MNKFIKQLKAGFAMAKWQQDNAYMFTMSRYEDVALFTCSDTAEWFGSNFYACATETGIVATKEMQESVHKDFVLMHELGHIKLGHLNDGKGDTFFVHHFKRALGNKDILNNEFAADAYAAERVGYDKAIQCLQYMKTLGLDNKELDKRIAKLVKVQKCV